MITIAEEIDKEKILTIKDMHCGDTFIIHQQGWANVYLMCDNKSFVNVSTGVTFDAYDYDTLTVHKFDFTLIKK